MIRILYFILGCILLPFFPIVVLIDLLISEAICGMLIEPEVSVEDCWNVWKETFIKEKKCKFKENEMKKVFNKIYEYNKSMKQNDKVDATSIKPFVKRFGKLPSEVYEDCMIFTRELLHRLDTEYEQDINEFDVDMIDFISEEIFDLIVSYSKKK